MKNNWSLESIVGKVRLHLETARFRSSYIGFSDFPYGSCSDASCLLGIILKKYEFGEWNIVQGIRNTIQSHAWLTQGHVIIDITADQFNLNFSNWVLYSKNGSHLYKSFNVIKEISVSEYYQNIRDINFYQTVDKILNSIISEYAL